MRGWACRLLTVSLLLAGCSKESPVEPQQPPGQQATTAIIGPAGGTLACQGFSMSIPTGAFLRPETLTVQEVADDGTFGSSAITRRFRLDGLPSDFSGMLQLALTCTRTPTSGFFVALGRQGLDIETGEYDVVYAPLPASLDSSRLKAGLAGGGPTGWSARKVVGRHTAAERISHWLVGLQERDEFVSLQGHFRMFFPRDARAGAEQVAQYLEEAYRTIDLLGLLAGSDTWITWPLDVTVVREQSATYRFIRLYPLYEEVAGEGLVRTGCAIKCTEDALSSAVDQGIVRQRAFYQLSFLGAMAIDPLFLRLPQKADLFAQANRVWPYTAYAIWMAYKFASPGIGASPPLVNGTALLPLQGIPVPPTRSPYVHGEGMAALMKHLADTYGDQALTPVYRAVPTATHAIDVLLDKIPAQENVWWPEFMKRYLGGEIYGVEADTLLQEITAAQTPRVFDIASKWDTLKTFSSLYADLSAKLYRVNLRYPDISTNGTMTFELGPSSLNMNYVTLLLFGLKDHALHFWQSGTALELPGLRDLTDQGYDIIAAVVNSANQSPYTGTLGIDLTVTLRAEATYQASVALRTAGTFTYSDGRTSYSNNVQYGSVQRFLFGTLQDGVFTAQWDTLKGVKRVTGSWTIQFDFAADPPRVTYFRVRETETSDYDVKTWDIQSGNDCSIAGRRWTDGITFEVRGAEVMNHLAPITYQLATPPTVWWTLTTTEYDAESFLEIELQ